MKLLIFFFGLLFFIGHSQNFIQTQEKTKEFCDDIMNDIKQSKVINAMDKVKMVSIVPESEVDQLSTLMLKHLNMLKSQYGDITGVEYIKTDTVKDILIKYTYFLMFEHYAIKYYFVFYHNKGYMMITLKYNDNIDDLFTN